MPEEGGRTTRALVDVRCPACQRSAVVPYGQHAQGTPRDRCHHRAWPRPLCLLPDADQGRGPAVQPQRVALTLPGRGGRAIGRGLGVRAAPGIAGRKKNASRHAGERKAAPHAGSAARGRPPAAGGERRTGGEGELWGQHTPGALVVARARPGPGTALSRGLWPTRGGARLTPASLVSALWPHAL